MDSVKGNAAVAISKESIAPSVGFEATGNPANTLTNAFAHFIKCVGDFVKNDLKWCILFGFACSTVNKVCKSNTPPTPAPGK